jgi:hypothetical protein
MERTLEVAISPAPLRYVETASGTANIAHSTKATARWPHRGYWPRASMSSTCRRSWGPDADARHACWENSRRARRRGTSRADLVAVEKKIKDLTRQIKAILKANGSGLMDCLVSGRSLRHGSWPMSATEIQSPTARREKRTCSPRFHAPARPAAQKAHPVHPHLRAVRGSPTRSHGQDLRPRH